ncbi:MAG: beta-ketoacyl-ACP synthase [Cyanobacteria bacterium P01_H01_bin.130]
MGMLAEPVGEPTVEPILEPIVITGLGVTTALGDRDLSWRRLVAGESALAMRQPFPLFPVYPLAMIGQFPVALESLLFQTAREALADADLLSPDAQVHEPLRTGAVVGSSRSFQGDLERLCDLPLGGDGGADGVDFLGRAFLRALPQQSAIAAAQQFGIQGPVSAPMAACATGIWAIAQGVLLLRSGQCDQVLVVTADAPITPLCLAGFGRLKALARDGVFPFDCDRQGLALGEGAAAFVLETESHAAQRQVMPYGHILGLGLTADATHMTAPDESFSGVSRALHQCLLFREAGGRSPSVASSERPKIGYVHAHGTATRRNDIQEAAVIQRYFPNGVPVSSTKGATGHTLGASGGLGVAWSLLALRHQQLPPCTGLRRADFDLDFVKAGRTQLRTPLEAVLCLAFGFGGQNTAIALGKS